MIIYENKTNISIKSNIIKFLGEIKDLVCKNEVELIIVNDSKIRELNKKYLGKDYATDVLSFGINYDEFNLESSAFLNEKKSLNSAKIPPDSNLLYSKTIESKKLESKKSLANKNLQNKLSDKSSDKSNLSASSPDIFLILPLESLPSYLKFSYLKFPHLELGSIVISIDKAIEVCKIYNHSLRDELAILFTHALLHLLGFDHEIDNGEHRSTESLILQKFGIDSSLITRTLS